MRWTRREVCQAIGALTGVSGAGCVGVNAPAAGTRTDEWTATFEESAEDVGIDYSFTAGDAGIRKMISNAGVYAADINQNGWTDLLLVGGAEPVVYLNTEGTFSPVDVLPPVDIEVRVALFVDLQATGYPDLLLFPQNDTARYLKNKGGTFEHAEVGIEVQFANPVAAAAADYTGNGYPDIFVAQNGEWGRAAPAGVSELTVPTDEDNGSPNRLFANEHGRLRETTAEAGIVGDHWSLATSFVDLTGNGWPDIHVANDFNRDVLYRNDGSGEFIRERLPESTNRNGMASATGDVTGNGMLDVFVTNIWYPEDVQWETMQRLHGNNLLLNEGDGSFEDQATELGVEQGGWGWAAVMADFANDGRLDIVHATQHQRLWELFVELRASEIDRLYTEHPFFESPAMFIGGQGGFTSKHGARAGFKPMDSRGVATLDLDRDGRVDLVFSTVDGPYHVYRNAGPTGNAIQIDLRPGDGGTVLGTRVTAQTSTDTYLRVRDSRSDFLSQSARVLHVGVGDAGTADLTVQWPEGSEDSFEDVDAGTRYVIDRHGIRASEPFR